MKIKGKGKTADKRGRGVLMEDLDAKLDLVLEGYSALDKKIDHNHGEFLEFKSETNVKFEVVFEEFKGIKGELRGIHSDLNHKLDREEFELFRKESGLLRGI